jgi:TonB family protein
LHHPASPERGGLWAAGIFSLLLHLILITLLTVGLKPTMTKMKPSFYRVTIRPYAPQGDGSPLSGSPAERQGPAIAKSAPPAVQKTVVEKIKPAEKAKPPEKTKAAESEKGRKTVEGLKSPQKRSEKKVPTAEKEELSEKQKESLKNLHEELENIRRKAALDEIKKKILRREAFEKEWAKEASAGSQSQGAIASGSGTGTGTGAGTGSGMGTGSSGSPTGGSPWGSSSGGSALESRLSDYYDSIWAKIKKEWTLPENLPKGRTTLETTIVIVIDREGKIQKSWFERKSGNTLFDQRAMRAIKKAEPLPPIPKEFSDTTLEMGFRFHPD